jgi:selenide,water dikinase
MRADLSAMLLGATEVLHADGCALVGGHSAEAAEAALGFAVSGLVDSGKLLRKAGLRLGDRLILTKPLGTGLILAANMRAQARAAWLQAAVVSMRTTNATACRIIMAHRPSAGTDVTGFGLAGHLDEMLYGTTMEAVLRMEDIPLLPGARALAAHGVESTLGPENRGVMADFGGTDAVLLADPQTSGGLLVGIPAQRAEACLNALLEAGVPAAMIGEVDTAHEGAGRIRLE